MTLTGILLLWFLLALGCVLAGTALTRRRAKLSSLAPQRPLRRASRSPARSNGAEPMILRAARPRPSNIEQNKSICIRCAQPLDVGAHFCGFCGLRLDCEKEIFDPYTKLVKRG